MTQTTFYLAPTQSFSGLLSAEQKRVENLSSNARAVVFGSPGSGKTTALRALFLKHVENGLDPSEILVLAGSREAANILRDNLAVAHAGATAGPMARTLPSFAFQVLRHQALAKGLKSPELISGAEQDMMLKSVLATAANRDLTWPKSITPHVMSLKGFRSELRDLITVCLEYRVSPSSLAELGAQNRRPEWMAASELYSEYLAKLREPEYENRHDASTLLGVAADLLETSTGFTADVAAIKLVLIDDAQELTPAARRLVTALVSRGAGLVLFGDPDTATLGFRAADPRSMSTLMHVIGASPEQIVLKTGGSRRSPALSRVLANISAELPSEQAGLQRRDYSVERTKVEQDDTAERHVFKDAVSEAAWVARRLRELHLDEKIAWSEIAVVARARTTLDQLSASFAAESIPVSIRGSRVAFRDSFATHSLLRLAQIAHAMTDVEFKIELDTARQLLLSPFCGLDSVGLRRFRRSLRREELQAGGQRSADELMIEVFAARASVATMNTREGRIVNSFLTRLFAASTLFSEASTIDQILWQLWAGTPAHRDWLDDSTQLDEVGTQLNQNLDALVALFAAANRFVERNPSANAFDFVEQQLAVDIPEDSLALNDRDDNRVSLVTPAGLIGRRYRVIVTPQMQDGIWPNLKPRSSLLGAMTLDHFKSGRSETVASVTRNELPDELRMLHKAVGAASERLIATAVDSEDQQVSGFFSTMFGEIPDAEDFIANRYTLRGLVGVLRRQLIESTKPEERLACALGLARLQIENTPGASADNWYGLLPISTEEPLVALEEDPKAEVWVKPSQLDDFLSCPLHWFMNAHGATDKTFETSLGILLHSAMENEEGKTEEQLWQLIEDRWGSLQFEADWLEQRERRKAKRMLGVLVSYLDQARKNDVKVLGREVEFKFQLGRAVVSGKVDRIEQNSDGTIMIVDLKTSASLPSKADTQENPQLGIYQLAFAKKAFNHVEGIDDGSVLAGAKLMFVSQNKPAERGQDSIVGVAERQQTFEKMVEDAVAEMSLTKKVFVANVGSHCSDSNSYGNCKLHLAKAVTFGG
jgi:superfamily I DNA/RNA helicase/RecB family exonuclease